MPDSDEDAAILREATAGRPLREIAKARGMLVSEVSRVLDLAATNMFSGESTRRDVMLESERLNAMKQRLWERYMTEGDNPSAALYIKASERLSSLRGWNHPLGHVVQVIGRLGQIEPEDYKTNTQRMLEAIRALRGESETAFEPDQPADC